MFVQDKTFSKRCIMKIAVVGSGISGMASAWLLARRHQVTLFEADSRLGGHSNTVDVTLDGVTHPVDTGFLVHNDRIYPNLIRLFSLLGVDVHPSDMSFALSLQQPDLEWAGTDLAGVFAQKANLLRPSFWLMLRDILRFNAAAPALLQQVRGSDTTLQQVLEQGRYSSQFRDWYLLPMAAAIWSSPAAQILRFPAETFLSFCLNHALLQVNDRPQWRTVLGGARQYVGKLAAGVQQVHVNTPVQGIWREKEGVRVLAAGREHGFDTVVLACHAPQTLALLQDADPAESRILGAFSYQPNRAYLHTDTALLPRREQVWSAWNYLAGKDDNGQQAVCVSYLINKLQPLPFKQPVIVTLNPLQPPDPAKTIQVIDYQHPLFDTRAIAAQGALASIQGNRRTWFCGAWGGYGFHEDGLKSALRVVQGMGVDIPWQVEGL